MKTFDELLNMSDEEITLYRKQQARQLINSAPKEMRTKLLGFQEELDASLASCSSPEESLEMLEELMHDQLQVLSKNMTTIVNLMGAKHGKCD